jgi:hypothetical protein
MIFFSLEDYFFNIVPFKRWGFLIIFILLGSIWQIKRFAHNYHEDKKLQQDLSEQKNLLNKLKDILEKKNSMVEYCDFYKLNYAELKTLLTQIINSNNYVKNIIIEPDNEKISVQLDFDN